MNEKAFEGRPAKEIADHPGVHYATVCRAVKRAEDKMHDCNT
jgi:DNA-directed RNA polymerase specialized sigma24 family protein